MAQVLTSQQQINAMVVQAVAYSAYATALGVAISTMGLALETAPHPDVIRDLKIAFGSDAVDKAIKKVGKDDMHALAKEIDRIFVEDLRTKYGDYATDAALQAAPPGETRKVEEIAKIISGRGITVATPAPVAEKVTEAAKKRAARKHPPKPLQDTKTGVIYKSLHAAYLAVGVPEFGMDPKDSWGIYAVMKAHPDRFKKVSVEEYLKYKESTQ